MDGMCTVCWVWTGASAVWCWATGGSHHLKVHEVICTILRFLLTVCKLWQGHRVVEAGRNLRRSLVEPSAHSMVSYGIRPGCSGLYSVGSWKPRRIDTVQSVGYLSQCLTVLIVSYVNFSSFIWCSLLVILLSPHHCEELGSISLITSQ